MCTLGGRLPLAGQLFQARPAHREEREQEPHRHDEILRPPPIFI
jgi:hypothetical protein